MNKITILLIFALIAHLEVQSQDNLQQDIIKTNQGDLTITFIGHASIMFKFQEMIIYVDPSSSSGSSFENLPKADLILITHNHGDHLDAKTLKLIVNDDTEYISNKTSFGTLAKGKIIANNESITMDGLFIEAVPAYNIKHLRNTGEPYHPKKDGNGYVLTFGDKRIYVAGDTENVPEMANLKNIDIAFLPMNIPYTMTPEMVKDAALLFKPKVIYPYHYRGTDPNLLIELLKDYPEIEVKIRKM
ncbi:MAG: metal-dependent hydrolase [Bacteroidetes bacterium HGW-Bacteroidetes-17]|jgi:L-ascorbate metabolism protein UlaG (beta-lactamase superfamily)|nr:MAG: metal-dependent hydrolase [Bacteroidetes bacterium HGW-Bacteroidetes-17]